MVEGVNRNEAVCERIVQDCVLNEKILPRAYASGIQRVIAVSGAAALGKTTMCRCLAEYLKRRQISASHVELDGFLRSRQDRLRLGLRGYNPRATDLVSLLNTLGKLIHRGESVEVPIYSHQSGFASGSIRVDPTEVIILDGIMSLHYEVREHFSNFGIFLRADDLVMRGHRLRVDMEERGYTVFEALSHLDIEGRSYDRWIYHQIDYADLILAVDKDWGLLKVDGTHIPGLPADV